MRGLLLCVLALGCGTSPPAPVCGLDAGPATPLCELEQEPVLVEAEVAAWAPSARAMALTGFDDVGYTPVSLSVKRVLKGDIGSRIDVLLQGCVDSTGASLAGPLSGGSGYFYATAADGYWVVLPQWVLLRDGQLLRNPGVFADGVPEATYLSRRAACGGGADAGS